MSKFVINRGIDNEFVLTVKQNGTTLPMVIEGSDTFTATLHLLETGAVVTALPVTVTDAVNGKITVTVSSTLADTLEAERGDKADYYYTKPLYKLKVQCSTVNNGDFTAVVDKVYVD